MKRIIYILTAVMTILSCGQTYEEKKQIQHKRRIQLWREDSAALKIAVMPTLDCLPLFVAKEYQLFDSLKADIRLKLYTAQMDCDTAVTGEHVEGVVTDIVRAERMQKEGMPLRYISTTNAYWQLYSNRLARIKQLSQLEDKMIGMTRYSATDLLADAVVDSMKLNREKVFKIQVNDVYIRLKMLIGGEIDAVFLTEPQATQARLAKHQLLMDSRRMGLKLGVIAFREKSMKNEKRQKQIEVFKKGYDQACDSINRYGVGHYGHLLTKYCKIKNNQTDSVIMSMKFQHLSMPSDKDIENVRKWLYKL